MRILLSVAVLVLTCCTRQNGKVQQNNNFKISEASAPESEKKQESLEEIKLKDHLEPFRHPTSFGSKSGKSESLFMEKNLAVIPLGQKIVMPTPAAGVSFENALKSNKLKDPLLHKEQREVFDPTQAKAPIMPKRELDMSGGTGVGFNPYKSPDIPMPKICSDGRPCDDLK